jgi:anti-sigma factor RsiW
MRNNPFSEELIAQYLLGDLPEEEQVEIEGRAFRDQQYLQNILAVENDLIDEYVRGELSDSERRQFESRFFASAERRRKVKFARALTSVFFEPASTGELARHAVTPALTWRDSFAAFLRGLNPALRFSLAAAALLILFGGSGLVVETLRLRAQLRQLQAERQTRQHEQQVVEQQLAEQYARSEDLTAQLQGEREQRERNEELLRELQREQEESATRSSRPTIISLMLLPGISRSSANRPEMVLPKSARRARLQIGISPGDEYKSFRAELRAQGGKQVWTQDNLFARRARAGRAIILNLPASVLSAGEYELALKGVNDRGAVEDVGYYYFSVLKK